MPRKPTTPKTMGANEQPDTGVEPMADGKAMMLTTDGIGDQPPVGDTVAPAPSAAAQAVQAGTATVDTGLVDTAPATADQRPDTGCQNAGNCAQAGRAPWKFHVDKDGQRGTATEANGSFWNRACPADGCNVRVFL